MTIPETVIIALITYGLMILAVKFRRNRRFHLGAMSVVIFGDLLFPFYLYATRDWKARLIDDGEILTFLVWMHIGLVLTMYVLYYLQVKAGKALRQGDESARADHQIQGRGILLTRALVISTGWMLYEPPEGGE